ncbi:hypothetical protein TrispH2_009207, partial [Trichoplax sp. H2]
RQEVHAVLGNFTSTRCFNNSSDCLEGTRHDLVNVSKVCDMFTGYCNAIFSQSSDISSNYEFESCIKSSGSTETDWTKTMTMIQTVSTAIISQQPAIQPKDLMKNLLAIMKEAKGCK